jgi:DNA-directed RNA polymerase subunit RPC12/RpoP
LNNKKVIDKYFVLPDGSNNFEALDKSEVSEKKESGEKWIKCVNCKKKFTQTIHKGKKSLPICPYCGTNNDIISESEISPYFKRRLFNDLPNFIRSEYQWLAPWSFNDYDEYMSRIIFNVVREISNSSGDATYEETMKIREKIEPIITEYIVDNFLDEIYDYYLDNQTPG